MLVVLGCHTWTMKGHLGWSTVTGHWWIKWDSPFVVGHADYVTHLMYERREIRVFCRPARSWDSSDTGSSTLLIPHALFTRNGTSTATIHWSHQSSNSHCSCANYLSFKMSGFVIMIVCRSLETWIYNIFSPKDKWANSYWLLRTIGAPPEARMKRKKGRQKGSGIAVDISGSLHTRKVIQWKKK